MTKQTVLNNLITNLSKPAHLMIHTKNKGSRSLSFKENVDLEWKQLNMSRWNISLLGTAVVGFASIVITLTCLVCFCCILNKRKNKQKNQKQNCSPDLLMKVAVNYSNLFLTTYNYFFRCISSQGVLYWSWTYPGATDIPI